MPDKANSNESAPAPATGQAAGELKSYSPPRLRLYGTVGEMTASGSFNSTEGNRKEANRSRP